MVRFYKYFLMVMLGSSPLALAFGFPDTARAQVWDCGGQYTNIPTGKNGCQPAGGFKACGSDGNRYFSPRRAGEASGPVSCAAPERTGLSPIVDMRQVELAKFGGSLRFERMVAPARSARVVEKKTRPVPEVKKTSMDIEDLFSCFSTPDTLKPCGPAGLGHFVEETFLNASKALQ